jgi:hypothetical protein
MYNKLALIKLSVVGLFGFCIVGFGIGSDWNQFRGPNGNGFSSIKKIPLKWGKIDNIVWKIEVPGTGYSSPVISNDKVFLTTCLEDSKDRVLLCYDLATGKENWRRVVFQSALETRHQNSSCANSTPAADKDRVYSSFLDKDRYVLLSHDHFGKEIWRKDLGKYVNKHGFCSSPILTSGMVVVAGDNDEAGFVAAINPETGLEVWRHNRENSVRSFSVVVPAIIGDQDQLLLAGCRSLTSFEPQSGKPIWKVNTPTEKFVAAPVISEGIAVVSGSSPANTMWGVDPTGKGDVTGSKVLWKENQNALYTCSPVAVGPWVFGVTDNGIGWCIEAKTGKKQWTERLGKAHHASLIYADGHIFALDEEGICYVYVAGPKFQLISKNKISEPCHATPAIGSNYLILRSDKSLFRIEAKQ